MHRSSFAPELPGFNPRSGRMRLVRSSPRARRSHHTPRVLAAAFGVDAKTMLALIDTLQRTTLDLASVSALHRVIVLARLASMSPIAFVKLAMTLGAPTFAAPVAPAEINRLMTRITALAAAGFDAGVIARLTGDQPGPFKTNTALKNLETTLASAARRAGGAGGSGRRRRRPRPIGR